MAVEILHTVIQKRAGSAHALSDNSQYLAAYSWAGSEQAIRYGWAWLLGDAPYTTWFSDASDMVKDLLDHEGVEAARAVVREELKNKVASGDAGGIVDLSSKKMGYSLAGAIGVLKFVRDYSVVITGEVLGGNLSVTFLGSYGFKVVVASRIDTFARTADVYFQIHNVTGLESGTRLPGVGYVGKFLSVPTASMEDVVKQALSGRPQLAIPKSLLSNRKGKVGMMTNREQYLHWGERLRF